MDIIQRIHSAYLEMTKKQKSIADCLLSHLKILHISPWLS